MTSRSLIERAATTARLLEEWKDVPVGTVVDVLKDDGSVLRTRTRSAPWDLCGVAVISVDDIRGGFAVSRMRIAIVGGLAPIPTGPTGPTGATHHEGPSLAAELAIRADERDRIANLFLAKNEAELYATWTVAQIIEAIRCNKEMHLKTATDERIGTTP